MKSKLSRYSSSCLWILILIFLCAGIGLASVYFYHLRSERMNDEIPSWSLATTTSPAEPVITTDQQENKNIVPDRVNSNRTLFVRSDPYYAVDTKKIYYQDTSLPIADPDSFKVVTLYSGYALVEDEEAYITNRPVYAYDDVYYYKNAEVIGTRENPSIRVFGDIYILVEDELFGMSDSVLHGIGRIKIANPHSLQYLGATFFTDGQRVYSMAAVDNCLTDSCTAMKAFLSSVTPTQFAVVPMDIWEHGDLKDKEIYGGYYKNGEGYYIAKEPQPRFAIVNDQVRTFIGNEFFGIETRVGIIEEADPASFEYIGGHYSSYAKDKNRVYHFDGLSDATILQEADVDTFNIYYPDPKDKSHLGIDTDSVYFKDVWLEGIDPNTMVVQDALGIIQDTDTVWVLAGNCHYMTYREATFEELPTYRPPC
jgi:hypothetical protein